MSTYLPGLSPLPPIHQDGSGDCWFTPPSVLAAIDATLGPEWFDPCADPRAPAWRAAHSGFDVRVGEDGLGLAWPALPVFANPPFSHASRWIARCARHPLPVVGLFPARMEGVSWHKYVWPSADVVLPRGRIRFVGLDGRKHGCAMIGTAFVCWGGADAKLLAAALCQNGLECVALAATRPLAPAQVLSRPLSELLGG